MNVWKVVSAVWGRVWWLTMVSVLRLLPPVLAMEEVPLPAASRRTNTSVLPILLKTRGRPTMPVILKTTISTMGTRKQDWVDSTQGFCRQTVQRPMTLGSGPGTVQLPRGLKTWLLCWTRVGRWPSRAGWPRPKMLPRLWSTCWVGLTMPLSLASVAQSRPCRTPNSKRPLPPTKHSWIPSLTTFMPVALLTMVLLSNKLSLLCRIQGLLEKHLSAILSLCSSVMAK